jgi:peptide/nickel transport system substrate-binding protein
LPKILNKIPAVLLTLIILLSGIYLFFEGSFGGFVNVMLGLEGGNEIDYSGKTLKIAYLFAPQNLDPFTTDSNVRSRLNDVYEGLVATNGSLKTVPALAVSWGRYTDLEWEFMLRENVKFHDGSDLLAEDVLYSFEKAMQSTKTGMSDLMSSVDKIEKVDQRKIKIVTSIADPLLLTKLAQVPIVKANMQSFEKPNGTGPYQIADSADLNKIIYQRNINYWGNRLPYFQNLEIVAIQNKEDRIVKMKNGEIDFLANVPPDSVDRLKTENIKLAFIPSLEVGFIMFNYKSKNFVQKPLREAIYEGLNRGAFLELANGYAQTESQFVSSGVFGYNPEIVMPKINQTDALEKVKQVSGSFQNLKTDFYYPADLGMLGQFIQEEFRTIGIDVKLFALPAVEYQERLFKADMPIYFLGWRSELGDAIPFLQSVVHSKTSDGRYGLYNGSNYSNTNIDQQIENAERNLDPKIRLETLQNIMKTIVDEEIIGIPVFETDLIFAYSNRLFFQPRVDGMVYPSAIYMVK